MDANHPLAIAAERYLRAAAAVVQKEALKASGKIVCLRADPHFKREQGCLGCICMDSDLGLLPALLVLVAV